MCVRLRRVRHIEVDHVGDAAHVDTARRNVCCHQDVVGARAKAAHGPIPLALGHVALKTHGAMPRLAELLGQSTGPALRAGEDNGRIAVVAGKQVLEQCTLPRLRNQVQRVIDGGSRRGIGQLDHVRVGQQIVSQPANVLRHRGREQQVLPTRRQCREDPANVRQEAHVEHVVRLVQHEGLDLAEMEQTPLEQVEHAARAAHHDLRAPSQCVDLASDRDAAIDRDHLHAREPGERAELGRDLGGELPGGGDHQCARALATVIEEPVEQRQRIGRRLASAGLGQAQHVPSGKSGWNGLELDLPGAFEACVPDSSHEGFLEPEPVESGRAVRY